MKLRNKKTGETIETYPGRFVVNSGEQIRQYDSLAELNEEWEDYEEPKEKGYFIDIRARKIKVVADISLARCKRRSFQELGLYFDTREEAEKAVEKLKAWKRLKDKGFRFIGWDFNGSQNYRTFDCFLDIRKNLNNPKDTDGIRADLDLLFGGEE